MSILSKIAGFCDPRHPVGLGAMAAIAATTLILDQLTKLWAGYALRQDHEWVIIPGVFNLAYRINTGAAFSILTGHTRALALFSVLISVIIAVWGWRLRPGEQGLRVPLGLILGGAVGNLIDRVRLGHVVDFIDVHWRAAHWPTFNVGDSAICVGMVMILIATLRPPATAQSGPARSDDASGRTQGPDST